MMPSTSLCLFVSGWTYSAFGGFNVPCSELKTHRERGNWLVGGLWVDSNVTYGSRPLNSRETAGYRRGEASNAHGLLAKLFWMSDGCVLGDFLFVCDITANLNSTGTENGVWRSGFKDAVIVRFAV